MNAGYCFADAISKFRLLTAILLDVDRITRTHAVTDLVEGASEGRIVGSYQIVSHTVFCHDLGLLDESVRTALNVSIA